MDYILNSDCDVFDESQASTQQNENRNCVARELKPLCCIHSRNLSRIILMLTCVSAKTSCVTQTVRLRVCV